jgi:hypothetical protein
LILATRLQKEDPRADGQTQEQQQIEDDDQAAKVHRRMAEINGSARGL